MTTEQASSPLSSPASASSPRRPPIPAHPRAAAIAWAVLLTLFGLDRLVLHPALAQAVEGDPAPWLEGLLSAVGYSAAQVLPAYENVATRLNVVLVPVALLFTLGAPRLGMDRFFDRHVGEARPEVLGFLRIVTGTVLFFHVIVEDIAGAAYYPASLVQHHGFFGLLNAIPGVSGLFLSPPFMAAFEWVALGAAALAAVGLGSRVTVPLAAATYFVCAAIIRQPSWSFHLGLIPWYGMAILVFFRSGDALSLDSWLARRFRGRDAPREPTRSRLRLYGWGRFSWVAVLTLPYFFAGLSKLSDGGLLWGSPNNMRNILYTCSLNDMNLDFDLGLTLGFLPDAFYGFLGVAAVYGEVAMVLTLFTWWGRLVFPAMMFFMHAGIMVTQNILFWDLMVMLAAVYAMAYWDRDGGPWDLRWLWQRFTRRVRPEKARRTALRSTGPSRPPKGLLAFAGVAVFCWIFAIEFFPLTAMQMFSRPRNPPGLVRYYHLYAEHEDGRRVRAKPDDVLPALRAPRFRRAYKLCFVPEKQHICDDTLGRLVMLHNADAAPGDAIVAYEVERREWDFLAAPKDPSYGETVANYRFPADRAPDREGLAVGPGRK